MMADYIDRQKLIDDFHTAGSCFVYGDYIPAIVSRIKTQPAIEPETMPVVRELREKLVLTEANQQHFKEERDEFKFKMREVAEAANAEIDRRNKTIAELREKLKRVKAERDAALADLKYTASCECCAYGCKNLEVDHCFDCGEKECRCRNCLGGDCWEWRGPVAENATAESEPKPQRKELAELQLLDSVGTKEDAEKNHVPGAASERSSHNG